jgi:hypothetical protein
MKIDFSMKLSLSLFPSLQASEVRRATNRVQQTDPWGDALLFRNAAKVIKML